MEEKEVLDLFKKSENNKKIEEDLKNIEQQELRK